MGVAGARRQPRHAASVRLNCPESPIELRSGSYVIGDSCTVNGNITLSGDAALLVQGPGFSLNGSIYLKENAALDIENTVFLIVNHFVFETQDRGSRRCATRHTRLYRHHQSGYDASLPVQYFGYDGRSCGWRRGVLGEEKLGPGDFFGSSELRTSTLLHPDGNLPARLLRSGSKGPLDNGVWLEFRPMSKAILERIPQKPIVNLTLGRGKRGVGKRRLPGERRGGHWHLRRHLSPRFRCHGAQ